MRGGGTQRGAKNQVPAASLKLSHVRDPTPPWPSCYRNGLAGSCPMGRKEKQFSLRTTSVMTRLSKLEEQ